MDKIITVFDVCTDKANGYWDRGVCIIRYK